MPLSGLLCVQEADSPELQYPGPLSGCYSCPQSVGCKEGRGVAGVSSVSSALSSMIVVLQWVLMTALSSFPWAFPSHVSFLSLFSAPESVPSSQYLHLHNLGWSLPCWNLIWYKRELSFCVYNLYVCVPACSVMSNSLWPMDYSLPGSCPLLLLGESVGLPRQEYWSSLLFPPSGDLPTPGLNPHLLHWQANSSPLHHQWGIIYVSFCGIQFVHKFLLFLSF